jgi:hypothetical protein
MKIKRKLRYYCDYCKKSGGSKYHIEKHEKGCTLNPNRHCRFCELVENEQKPMSELLSLIPDVKQYEKFNINLGENSIEIPVEDANKILSTLREATNNCPICIMAALRQKGIPVPIISNFNYEKEVAVFWSDYNSNQHYNNF